MKDRYNNPIPSLFLAALIEERETEWKRDCENATSALGSPGNGEPRAVDY
jgi:hypothetical protein